jgi:hypothetical protein
MQLHDPSVVRPRDPLALQALRYTAVTAVALAVLVIVLALQHRNAPPPPLSMPRVLVEPSPGYPVRLVEVTKSEIRYQQRLVATVESVLNGDSPTFFVEALRDAVEKDAAKTFRPGQWIDLEKLQLSRMVLVQFDDQTDTRVERKVLYSLTVSGWQPIVHYVYDLH